jgi:BMFP domain-containing protein YqiC
LELDEETRARLAAVDQLEARVSELENRLDFTERLLAERTSPTINSD